MESKEKPSPVEYLRDFSEGRVQSYPVMEREASHAWGKVVSRWVLAYLSVGMTDDVEALVERSLLFPETVVAAVA